MLSILPYARKKVFFWQGSSPIFGQFDDAKYPFVRKPLLSVDDIRTKSNVLYGPTQSLKTVVLQIVIAYVLDMWRASTLAVAQSDDDARSFSSIKLGPFLERIESLLRTLQDNRSAKTLSQWLWAAHELIISGPGENAQESKSVRCLCTDEAHRYCISNPGALTALRNRMGDRWDRMEYHATTAADVGTEIDIAYMAGHQAEWHQSCIYCHKPIWPLWFEESQKVYNGHRVFQWKESQSETETLDSIRMVCPHCDKVIQDTLRNRIDLDEGADYVSMNPCADISTRSFRYNVFAARWKSHRDILAIYLAAMRSFALGDLEPYKDWIKKKLVISWESQWPSEAGATPGTQFRGVDVPKDENQLRTLSADYQAGKKDEGKHWWALVEQWDKNGDSKRIAYRKVFSWDELRAMQLEFGVPDKGVGVDCGHEPREVFAVCAKYRWLALKSGDETGFAHPVVNPSTHVVTYVDYPFSVARPESSKIGTSAATNIRIPKRAVHLSGYALSRLWAIDPIYGFLYSLKNGVTKREYGIAADIGADFTDQFDSYIPQMILDKRTNTHTKRIWHRKKPRDHAWICAAQGVVLAMVNGFCPVVLEERKAA